MKFVRTARIVWLITCVLALLIAQLAFSGVPHSEVAGNLVFFLLVACLPSSLIAYPFMFATIDLFSTRGAYPFNSRVALAAVWACYVLLGVVQWYLVPAIIARVRSRRQVRHAAQHDA